MKRIIQAVVLASLFSGTQAALAFPTSADDMLHPAPVTRADRYADKGTPSFIFQSSNDDVLHPAAVTRADRYADKMGPALVFPSANDDVLRPAATPSRADRFTRGATDPALSQ